LLAWVQFQASLSEICDGRNGPGTGICLSTSVCPTHYHSTIQSSIKITLTNDIIVQNHTQEGLSSHLLHFDLKSQVLNSKYLLNIGVAFQKTTMQMK
jgi:hypothetical protein